MTKVGEMTRSSHRLAELFLFPSCERCDVDGAHTITKSFGADTKAAMITDTSKLVCAG